MNTLTSKPYLITGSGKVIDTGILGLLVNRGPIAEHWHIAGQHFPIEAVIAQESTALFEKKILAGRWQLFRCFDRCCA